jgi:hypothetical protein
MEQEIRECACLIVGKKYPWRYVENLYSMLSRHSSQPIRLHVLTEPDRDVPAPFIKHELDLWPEVSHSNLSWWYKMQLFDQKRFDQPMMYFDLDIVIVDNIDWLWHCSSVRNQFYSVQDFRYLQRPHQRKINSSVMSWCPDIFYWVWEDFTREDRSKIFASYAGDQDYLDRVIPLANQKFFDSDLIKSYRWQIQDGGWNFKKRVPFAPGTTRLDPNTRIVVFHGNPKPHEISSPLISKHWN